MDNHQYHPSSYMPQQQQQQQHHHQQYASYNNGMSAQHQQGPPSHENPTLPPLQATNNNFSHLPSLYTQHSASPHTPHGPLSGSSHGFPHLSSPAASGSMPPPPSYMSVGSSIGHPHANNSPAQASMPPASSIAAHSTHNRLPDIRPMPQSVYNSPVSAYQSYGHSASMMSGQESEPTHVVGSQGRRGILPSAPGRAAPPSGGAGASAKSLIPAKDAEGKFPCPHCNKSYLHAKHLKRHLLRHTGDRPYMCHLCKDTFSRSDILKRHFQKCSIRRGNPTGANHLAHQRRNTNGSNRLSTGNEPIGLAGLPEVAGSTYANGSMGNTSTSSPTVTGEHNSYASSVASMSNRSSRANSLINPGGLNADGRHGMSALGGVGSLASQTPNVGHHHTSSANYGDNTPAYAMRPQSMANHGAPNYSYGPPPMTNGQIYGGVKMEDHAPTHYNHNSQMQNAQRSSGGPGVDWTSVFSPSGQDGFMTQSQPEPSQMTGVKAEPGANHQNYQQSGDGQNDSSFFGLYSHPPTYGEDSGAQQLSDYSNWNSALVQHDPLQSKANALLTYLSANRTPPSTPSSNGAARHAMRECLTVDNIRHFAEQFVNFQGHWPIIHMPTFSLIDAYDGLVLAIVCIGAIYSDNNHLYDARTMMEAVQGAFKANSRVYGIACGARSDRGQPLGSLLSDLEEVQAFCMLLVMRIFHGTPEQRAGARQDLPVAAALVKAMDFCEPVAVSHYAYSMLHQPGSIPPETLAAWSWPSWIEQEKRGRALYFVFLLDAANVILFNGTPVLDSMDIRIPLPADDAVWDARSPGDCADALGLHGAPAQHKNVTGSRRPRQPDMRNAVRSLMDPQYTFQQCATNAYSKFILVHALMVQVCKAQRAAAQLQYQQLQSAAVLLSGLNSGPGTPLSSHDWVSRDLSRIGSGTTTPTDGFSQQAPQAHAVLNALHQAIQKWKTMWDDDINIQYPPGAMQERRFGFSRDGIHFYYLAQFLLRLTKPTDWARAPDARFVQVMGLLKNIRAYVFNNNYSRGLDFGSVGDIDDSYGVGDLTLDMKLVFRPYDSIPNHPVLGVHGDGIRGG